MTVALAGRIASSRRERRGGGRREHRELIANIRDHGRAQADANAGQNEVDRPKRPAAALGDPDRHQDEECDSHCGTEGVRRLSPLRLRPICGRSTM